MKRALPIIPFVLFVFLNACVPSSVPFVSPEIGTAVALTQTAIAWTETAVPPTSRFDSLSIINALNASLPEDTYLRNVQELENAMGARYDIVDARIVQENNLPDRIFEVEVSCFCNARTNNCCSPERTFAIVMRRMEYFRDSILWIIPDTVVELNVYCMDHDNRHGIISASWVDVEDYLYGRINGKQFGNRVWPE